MKSKHICFIVPNYPTQKDPMYTFVKELVSEIRDMGVKCTVIAPQSITNLVYKRNRRRPRYWIDKSNKGKSIEVYQPYTVHFLNMKLFGTTLSTYLTEWAYKRAFKKVKHKPDILYAHFWHSGVAAANLKSGLPLFVASGESKIWVERLYSRKKVDIAAKDINGVIAVSTKNKKESINLGLTVDENVKVKVIPNAVNTQKFYPMNRIEVRDKLGYNEDDFIVAYLGSFNERKGVMRLSEALKELPDVKSIFIGNGPLKPDNENILFQGRLPHDKVNLYLNAADIFVLPTLAEGSPNAVIEAMACGLPIVSSDLEFNDDILNENNSIRIDSNNVDEIKNAVRTLQESKELKMKMSESALKSAKELDIKKRAEKIISILLK